MVEGERERELNTSVERERRQQREQKEERENREKKVRE